MLLLERGMARRRRRAQTIQQADPQDTLGITFDVAAVIATIVLVSLGLANLVAVDGAVAALRQAAIAAAGLAALAWLRRQPLRLLELLGWAAYGCSVLALAVVLVAGSSANGATRWIGAGALTFQPSELAKMGLLLGLASVLGSAERDSWRLAAGLGLTVLPALLTLMQPDLSTTALLVILAAAMLVLSRIPGRFLLPLMGVALAAAPLAIGLLRPYQVERMGSFLAGAQQSPAGPGWAVHQAQIAIGSAALVGRSSGQLTDLLAQYLPERDTDLALASVIEQYGLLTSGLAVLAAMTLVWRLTLIGRASRTPQGALTGTGLAVLFGTEVVVSIGGNLGLLPLAGVPFPLLSYGGTALLVHLAALGTVLGVRRDGARRRLWRPPWGRRIRPQLARTAALGMTVALTAFGTYGWNLQRTRGPELTIAGQDQMTRCIRLPASRGQITDRHGVVLATSNTDSQRPTQQVLTVPALVRSHPGATETLANLVGRPADELRAQLASAPATTLELRVAEAVPAQVADSVAAAQLEGVLLVPAPRRIYPSGALLGPLLGFAGVATPTEMERDPDLPLGEIVGRSGLERQYDSVLRGIDGAQCVYVTPLGVPVAVGPRREPVPGADVRLSLDLGLQRQLTDGLVTALRAQSNPRAVAAAVAMDPRTGQVLALASAPAYDNNIYGPPVDMAAVNAESDKPGDPMLEHASQAAVPPGSTFKLVIAASDVVHRAIPPERVIPTGGSYTLGGHVFHNWGSLGPMNLPQSIAWSNDVYFYQLATALGPDRIIDTARALGVGSATGIDLPAESPGYLGSPESVQAQGVS